MERTENFMHIRSQLSSGSDKEIAKLEAQLARIVKHRNWLQEKLRKLEEHMPMIEKGFKALDLEVKLFNAPTWQNEHTIYDETCTLQVEFTCRMIGRRKPVNETRGYALSSSEKTRREKVRKSQQIKFFSITGCKIEINQFSLTNVDRVLASVTF